MDKREFLDRQFEQLVKSGSNKEDLKNLYYKALDSLKEIDKKSPKEAMSSLVDELAEESRMFLTSANEFRDDYIEGLSSCIYLPSYDGKEYKLKFVGGQDSNGKSIDVDTKFDVASITKMYTLLLTFKLIEYGFFSLDTQIASMDPRFKGLGDFTVLDLIKLCGELYTNGRIDAASNREEAMKVLETIYLKSDDRTRNLYTDMGMIVLSEAITKVISKENPALDSYDKIMTEYLFLPFGLDNTVFNPNGGSLAGNGNNLGLVHDPKARILGGAVGSAGIFTTSDDIAKLAKEMYRVNYVNYSYFKNLVSKKNLQAMGTITFPESPQSNKGLVGLYQKNPDRQNKWLNPLAYSDGTFTAQGFTGSVATFDPNNMINNSILVSAIRANGNSDKERYQGQKAKGFMNAFKIYQEAIVQKSLLLLLQKKYFEMTQQIENVDITKTI